MKTVVSRTLSVHQEHEFLRKLETAGLTRSLAQRVIESPSNELATKVVKFIQNGGFESPISQRRAREIMGENMFGVEEAIRHFKVNLTSQQILALAEVPFSEYVLQKTKDTHVLVAILPLSIREILHKVPPKLFSNRTFEASVFDWKTYVWSDHKSFAEEHGEINWQLVRKTLVNDSTSKNWQEQLALISEEDEVPTAQVLVYTIIGHYLATGELLFKNVYARTASEDSVCHVCVGYFDGLHIDSGWSDHDAVSNVGIASAWKPQKFQNLRS